MAFLSGGGAEAAKLVISLAVFNGPAMKALGDVQSKLADVGSSAKATFGKGIESAMLAFGNIGDAADGIRSVGGAINGIVGPMIMGAAKMETFAMQFEVLLGSADAAKERMADLSTFAERTPFELPGIVEASRLLQTFTDGALAAGDGLRMVGDIAAGTGKPIEDVAFKVGRMYDAFRSGTNIGESLMYLQEMGAISGETRRKIEGLAESVKNGSMTMEEGWSLATQGFGKFSGMTEKLADSTEGKLSTAIDAVNMALARLGEKFLPMVKTALDGVVVVADAFSVVAEKASKYWFLLAPIAIAAGKAMLAYAKSTLVAAGATLGLSTSMKVLWKSVLGPIGLVIAAIEVFSLAWENDFLGLRTVVEGVFKWLDDNFGWLIDIFGTIANAIGSAVGWMVESVQSLATRSEEPFNRVTTYAQSASDAVSGSFLTMAQSAQDSVGPITNANRTIESQMKGYFSSPWASAAIAAQEKSIRNAARQSLGTIPEEASKAREKLRAEMALMTADAVAEALKQKKAIADALSGAMDTATAERFTKMAVKGAGIDVEEAVAAVRDVQSRIAELREGGVTKAEQAKLRELQIEKTKAVQAREIAELNYQQRLADLTAYGDNATRISRLKAALAGGAFAEGLGSKDDDIRRSTIFALAAAYKEMNALKEDAEPYGLRTGQAWAHGITAATIDMTEAATNALAAVRRTFIAKSPPGPQSPLHHIDDWGYRTGAAWADGLSAGVGTADPGGAMPSMATLGSVARPPSTSAAALSGAGYASGPGAPGLGGGAGRAVVLQMEFHSAVPYTPAEQTELGQRVGPAVYDYLRSRGAV